ncbi:MAG TPA: AraC family transcriptional regulator [Mobilitalea sp.]|nr:AraC family transcriptional regulator [Mobilitalea sp.]
MKTSENFILSHEVILPQAGRDVYFRITTDKSSYVTSHWHNALEIIYIISGELEVTTANKVELLKQGDFTLINSKVVHSTKCLHGNEAVLLQLPYSFIKRYIPNIDSLIFEMNNYTLNDYEKSELMQMKEIINRMRILHEAGSTSTYLQFQSLLFELIYHLYQNFSIEIKHMDYNQRTKNLSKLEPIIEYTEMNYTKPITIEEISGIAALQPKYFCRFFKASMGSTYIEYLNELRLSYIYRDLISTNIPLVRLLEIHGFTNYKLFRRMFQERFHDTPSHIRKMKTPVITPKIYSQL